MNPTWSVNLHTHTLTDFHSGFNRWPLRHNVNMFISLYVQAVRACCALTEDLCSKHWRIMWTESWVSIVVIMSIKHNRHDWRAVECNLRMQCVDRSIRSTVSCGSLVIRATAVCWCAELGQWAPRVLLVQTGSRSWSVGLRSLRKIPVKHEAVS